MCSASTSVGSAQAGGGWVPSLTHTAGTNEDGSVLQLSAARQRASLLCSRQA